MIINYYNQKLEVADIRKFTVFRLFRLCIKMIKPVLKKLQLLSCSKFYLKVYDFIYTNS